MKKLVVLGILLLTAVLLFSEVGVAQQAGQKLITVNTAWMSEHELFFGWYAKEKGFDKQEGLDMKLLNFDSGMAIAEALPAKQWVLGATGGVPMVVTSLRYGAYLIGIGNNESWTNAVFVRPNNPVMKTKGGQKGYPDIYGKEDFSKLNKRLREYAIAHGMDMARDLGNMPGNFMDVGHGDQGPHQRRHRHAGRRDLHLDRQRAARRPVDRCCDRHDLRHADHGGHLIGHRDGDGRGRVCRLDIVLVDRDQRHRGGQSRRPG